MKIQLKDLSVNLDGLQAPILLAIWWAAQEYQRQGMESVTVTSARDGKHMTNSLHYCGCAVDLRRWGLPNPEGAATRIQTALGDQYDVILEETHLHIEWDPKT